MNKKQKETNKSVMEYIEFWNLSPVYFREIRRRYNKAERIVGAYGNPDLLHECRCKFGFPMNDIMEED